MWKWFGVLAALTVGVVNAKEPSCAEAVAAGYLGFRSEMPHYEVDAQTQKDLSLVTKIAPLLDTGQTTFGRARLQWLVTHPFTGVEYIRNRQHAAGALAQDPVYADIHASLARISRIVGGGAKSAWVARLKEEQNYPQFLAWILAGTGRVPFSLAWKAAEIGESGHALLWGLLGGVCVAGNIGVNESIRTALEENYRNLFEEISTLIPKLRRTRSPCLEELADVFSGLHDAVVNPTLTHLNQKLRTLWRANSPSAFFRYIFEITLVHSQFTVPPVQRALVRAREGVFALMGAIGELDTFIMAMAGHSRQAPEFFFPEILNRKAPELSIVKGHHPFWFARALTQGKPASSVANTLELQVPLQYRAGGASLALVTGPNKGGKSVYLRMVALAAIYAQIGAPFPGLVRMTPVQVGTRMRITDDEEAGESTFSEDATRIVELDRRLTQPSGLFQLVVCDEMLRGTHAPEADSAEQVLLEDWALSGNLAVVATHNLAVTGLSSQLPRLRNYHVDYVMRDGEPIFSYKIFEGPATTTSSFEILEAKGLRPEAVARMRRLRRSP